MAEVKEDDKRGQDVKALDYDETLMYGRYRKDLGAYAKKEAAKVRPRRADVPKGFKEYSGSACERCKKRCKWLCEITIEKIGEDWIYLTLLGIIMALLSFLMDYAIDQFQHARIWLYKELGINAALQYFAWVIFPLIFICFSTGFVHIVGPNAIGSGIPEMKTILRGVVLKEYLTFRTLVSKMVGLCTSLGSGLPIGKEGPFVHVASIAATLLGKLISSFRGIYENESRNSEMLAAACAVGVACTFAAPIGGVLFSIEVTATYFAVRNYWRGFYSAVCGAFVFRLLAIFFKNEETLTALFKTSLRQEFPFGPFELLAFSTIGIVCGFGGALFVYTHRKIVEFIRKQKKMTAFLQKNRFIFPSVVVVLISSLTCPITVGRYMGGELTNREALQDLFSNFTWSAPPHNLEQEKIVNSWKGENLYLTLTLFIISRFCMSALATTLPVPAGVFMPVFTIGAAFGRLIGESMHAWFPEGINNNMVVPGGYAIVGAAALAGSVTHTVSTSVIVFELTGQMGHILPCVIAVLFANAIAHLLQPSFYDSLIQIKRLPFLPDIINPSIVHAHKMFVENFMVTEVIALTSTSTYGEAKELLAKHKYRAFPLIDSKESKILLGSFTRGELQHALDHAFSRERRLKDFWESRPQMTGPGHVKFNVEDESVEFFPTAIATPTKNKRFTVTSITSDTSSIMGGELATEGQDPMAQDQPSSPRSPSKHPLKRGEVHTELEDIVPLTQCLTNKSKNRFNVSKVDEEPAEVNLDDPVFKDMEDTRSLKSSFRSFKKLPLHKKLSRGVSQEVRVSYINKGYISLVLEYVNQSTSSIKSNLSRKVSVKLKSILKNTMRPEDIQEEIEEDDFEEDMTLEEIEEWENKIRNTKIEYEEIQIDPAPFQLVERTSLYRVHSLFSLLSLHHAYVTNTGRLVGVVALNEVRNAIQGHVASEYEASTTTTTEVRTSIEEVQPEPEPKPKPVERRHISFEMQDRASDA